MLSVRVHSVRCAVKKDSTLADVGGLAKGNTRGADPGALAASTLDARLNRHTHNSGV